MSLDCISVLEKHKGVLVSNVVFDILSASLIEKQIITKDEYKEIVYHRTDSGRASQLVHILTNKQDRNCVYKFIQVLARDYHWLADCLLKDINPDETDLTGLSASDTSLYTYQNQVNEKQVEDKLSINRKRNSNGQIVQSSPQTAELAAQVPETEPNTKEDDNARYLLLNQVITPDMMSVVRKNHRITSGWTKLAHSLGLSHQVTNIRSKVFVYCEDVDVSVVYLLKEWVGLQPKTATLENLINVLQNEGFNDVADELETKFILTASSS